MAGVGSHKVQEVDMVRDKQKILDLNSAIRAFIPGSYETLQYGESAGPIPYPVWFRFKVENQESIPQQLMLIVGLLRFEVDLYLVKNGKVVYTGKNGTKYHPSERNNDHRYHSFPIHLAANGSVDVYMRSSSFSSVWNSMSIHNERSYLEFYYWSNIYRGLFYGIIISLLIFNAFAWVTTRVGFYIPYCIYLITALVSMLLVDGIGHTTIFFGDHAFAKFQGVWVPCVSFIAGLGYSYIFLELHRFKVYRWLFGAVGTLLGVVLILSFSEQTYHWSVHARRVYPLVVSLVIMAASIDRGRTEVGPRYMFLAWLSFVLFSFLFTLHDAGIISNYPVALLGFHFGLCAETIIMGFGLGHRLRILTLEKIRESRRADQKSQEATEMRHLVHLMCHDIRNPLTVILGANRKLQRSPTDKCMVMKSSEKIERATNQVQEMISVVRELQALQMKKKTFELKQVGLKNLQEDITFTFEPNLNEKGLQFVFKNNTNLDDPIVIAEAVSLRQNVIFNLFSNAIKFSPRGSSIEVRLEYDPNQQCSIIISDRGVGIPPKKLDSLFDSSKSQSTKGTEGEQGSGFGLAITKVFIDLYGASIHVSSKWVEQYPENHGTTFEIKFAKSSEVESEDKAA